jgi:predicted glutamine amidotransferase
VCEMIAVRWPSPRPFDAVTDWLLQIERYGSCRLGWGAAWRHEGRVAGYCSIESFTSDREGRAQLRHVVASEFMVHLRRPTLLSTMQLADGQPFLDVGQNFAFCHNGNFLNEPQYRDQYRSQLRGGADSEVGFCMLKELLTAATTAADVLATVHSKLGGNTNLGYLAADGSLLMLSEHVYNQMWEFQLGDARIASTQLHSRDESIFNLVFSGATQRRQLPAGEPVAISQPEPVAVIR